MCRSVPQIDAAFTRTKTSVGPIAGTVADCRESPRAGLIFRRACMVAGMKSLGDYLISDANTRILRAANRLSEFQEAAAGLRYVNDRSNVAEVGGFAQRGQRVARRDKLVRDVALVAAGNDTAHYTVPLHFLRAVKFMAAGH